MGDIRLIQTLTESFIALSDEVQSLIDRKTILEHKLRYAHEQYQYLADKYAPAVPEVSETLAKLQLSPGVQDPLATGASVVPLPKRGETGSSQHQIALLIREGRKAAKQLAAIVNCEDLDVGGREAKESSARESSSVSPGMETLTSTSTVLEKDFTVEGKKGALACPFSAKPTRDGGLADGAERVDGSQDPAGATDPGRHQPADPICAAMFDDSASPSAAVPSKCPIRFLDKHSPEEIARYLETHKHAIPRSHEVCVRRYQRNEEQIRKLDAKYGNLVNMVKDLSRIHQPMLPPSKEEQNEVDEASNKRVEDWAQTVAAADPGPENQAPVDEERESRFDRPMRDVRVGESPSRPWGISVPVEAGIAQRREASPPAPAQEQALPKPAAATASRCPFDHSKVFGGAVKQEDAANAPVEQKAMPSKETPASSRPQPTFINVPGTAGPAADRGDRPPVVFNIRGPVFIGYPMEQAIEFMKQFQGH
ncbi:uncharacterized protein THITE_2113812 [Thermothielavioides terrestris NRRL 8126]|uniref:Uncharacterized protein n=1 Tax=Thermothielavioides terrestris (strain ATCC 38088 / NRRL 8126) TaxID=578455 RepID=G2R492_THETT|nr:uncharacterized protein THITE_2113812 [Thermothielavioides terrestris NRRL 8126]AEO66039.1 hypothetical protein THITE_2113812 [Thermothielavioides terrestris NRRL 8126]